jgi:outer membrane receptor protein involved in Fe transport
VGSRYQETRWWAELSGRFVTGQDRVPEGLEPTEGFAAFEVFGGYDLADQIQLQIAILNLGNKAYAEPFNEHLEPGRSFRVSVSYSF